MGRKRKWWTLWTYKGTASPITFKEYVPSDWFKLQKDEEEEEKMFFGCNMTMVDIDFKSR